MAHLTCKTAGESHGPASIALIEGLPSDLTLDTTFINNELARRQGGYGRGGRQAIEEDVVSFLAGVRQGRTTGAPLLLQITNNDSRLDDASATPPVHRPRPGHADLTGAIRWLNTDCRNTLERASARETAARTAAGAIGRLILREFNIHALGFVRGSMDSNVTIIPTKDTWEAIRDARDNSDVYCPDDATCASIINEIKNAKSDKDTVGGVCEVHVFGCPIGIGSCGSWQEKLDARIAGAVMGIQAFKSVEIGLGVACGSMRGSEVHDPIEYSKENESNSHFGFNRPTNHAGGIEGGMTNGMPIVVRGTMKPIATLLQGMDSVDLQTGKPTRSDYERSDVCALPAASVVMENVVGFEIASAFLDAFGGSTMQMVHASFDAYCKAAREMIAK
ncbi:MAG: chorismate synthase [Phycisphaerales bacterium]|jgi:chorismate synthase|nr:chorismate synthase [Phycisphaerales bacterium]